MGEGRGHKNPNENRTWKRTNSSFLGEQEIKKGAEYIAFHLEDVARCETNSYTKKLYSVFQLKKTTELLGQLIDQLKTIIY
jgi:hypothetical protein